MTSGEGVADRARVQQPRRGVGARASAAMDRDGRVVDQRRRAGSSCSRRPTRGRRGSDAGPPDGRRPGRSRRTPSQPATASARPAPTTARRVRRRLPLVPRRGRRGRRGRDRCVVDGPLEGVGDRGRQRPPDLASSRPRASAWAAASRWPQGCQRRRARSASVGVGSRRRPGRAARPTSAPRPARPRGRGGPREHRTSAARAPSSSGPPGPAGVSRRRWLASALRRHGRRPRARGQHRHPGGPVGVPPSVVACPASPQVRQGGCRLAGRGVPVARRDRRDRVQLAPARGHEVVEVPAHAHPASIAGSPRRGRRGRARQSAWSGGCDTGAHGPDPDALRQPAAVRHRRRSTPTRSGTATPGRRAGRAGARTCARSTTRRPWCARARPAGSPASAASSRCSASTRSTTRRAPGRGACAPARCGCPSTTASTPPGRLRAARRQHRLAGHPRPVAGGGRVRPAGPTGPGRAGAAARVTPGAAPPRVQPGPGRRIAAGSAGRPARRPRGCRPVAPASGPPCEPSVSVRSENRAGKPYLATTARRTEAMAAASRTTRAVPWKVGAPGADLAAHVARLQLDGVGVGEPLGLPGVVDGDHREQPGLVERRREPDRRGDRGAGAAEGRQRDVLRRGQRVVGGAHGCGTGIRLVHGDSVGGLRAALRTGFQRRARCRSVEIMSSPMRRSRVRTARLAAVVELSVVK